MCSIAIFCYFCKILEPKSIYWPLQALCPALINNLFVLLQVLRPDPCCSILLKCPTGEECAKVCVRDFDIPALDSCCECSPITCFPSRARVSLENGETVTMADLKRGDRIKTSKYKYSEDININYNI